MSSMKLLELGLAQGHAKKTIENAKAALGPVYKKKGRKTIFLLPAGGLS